MWKAPKTSSAVLLLCALSASACDLLREVSPPPQEVIADLGQLAQDQAEDQRSQPPQPEMGPADQAPDMPDAAPPLPWRTILRLNAGEAVEREIQGELWGADAYWSGSRRTSTRPAREVEGTTLDELFLSEAFRIDGYAIPVQNDTYIARLYLAETWDGITGPGQRVFDVEVEGELAPGVDPFAEAGGLDHALIREFKVEVTDGWLDIHMEATQLNTAINGLELLTQRGAIRQLPTLNEHARELPSGCGQTHELSPQMSAMAQQQLIESVQPGDIIELADGLYTNGLNISLDETHRASVSCPTIIRPKNARRVRIDGSKSRLRIAGSHVLIQGLAIYNGLVREPDDPLIEVSKGIGARLSELYFDSNSCSQATRTGALIHITQGAVDTRIDHSNFQVICGAAVAIHSAAASSPLRLRIDHNRFDEHDGSLPVIYSVDDDGAGPHETQTRIEHNLFDWVGGDQAGLIELSTAKDVIQHNTFRRYQGPSIRLNKSREVFMIGNLFDRAGAVQLGGERHQLLSNLFVRSGGVEVMAGHGELGQEMVEVFNASQLSIAHNTFWEVNGVVITLGEGIGQGGRRTKAKEISLTNNVFYAATSTPTMTLVELARSTGGELGVEAETVSSGCNIAQLYDPGRHRVGWPLLEVEQGELGMVLGHDKLPRHTKESPLVDSACALGLPAPTLWADFEGHPRPNSVERRDRGADEWSEDVPLAPAPSPQLGADGLGRR